MQGSVKMGMVKCKSGRRFGRSRCKEQQRLQTIWESLETAAWNLMQTGKGVEEVSNVVRAMGEGEDFNSRVLKRPSDHLFPCLLFWMLSLIPRFVKYAV